jgi:hypothetical protein
VSEGLKQSSPGKEYPVLDSFMPCGVRSLNTLTPILQNLVKKVECTDVVVVSSVESVVEREVIPTPVRVENTMKSVDPFTFTENTLHIIQIFVHSSLI